MSPSITSPLLHHVPGAAGGAAATRGSLTFRRRGRHVPPFVSLDVPYGMHGVMPPYATRQIYS